MKNIIFAQVLTAKAKTEFLGLYDKNGNPVTVETERDDSGVSVVITADEPDKVRRDCGISEEEIERSCAIYDDCGECPLCDFCDEEMEGCDDE